FVLDNAALTEQKEGVALSVRVRNIGDRPGRKVAQFYVHKSEARLEQPAHELCEFGKTRLLAPGEEETISVLVPWERLTSFDSENARWLLSEGDYDFFVGEDAARLTPMGAVTVREARVIRTSFHAVPPTRPLRELSKHDPWRPDGSSTFLTEEPQVTHYETFTRLPADAEQTEGTLTFADLLADPDKASAYAAQLSDEQLCRLCVSRFQSAWEMDIKGYAGRVSTLEGTDLPEYTLCDGNSGILLPIHSIGFPATSVTAASFDRELMRGVGDVMAEEARRLKVNCILGPGLNLHRDPLCGRHAEYVSEDPFLAGVMAGCQVKGLQEGGVSACIKHVAANNCESVRARSDSVMSERTLREMYLRPYACAMAVEPADTIMTGYNTVNGHYPDENEELIEGLFYGEMGFDGFSMCDWGSYSSSDPVAMMKAGLCLLTPGADDDSVTAPLLAAMEEGRLPRAVMVRNAARIIRTEAKRLNVRKTWEE
ncbi:MAG: fibronectin type III-like domain-contianing protein, partial [Clostridia bacterium]|nr:fibronectin type III-like domain-contianing protein [Clostridia bacterium]